MIIRFASALIIGGGVTIGLFLFMNYLISGDMSFTKSDDELAYMNFIRVKQESKPETKKRELPKEPPKPPKQPPKPKLNTQTKAQVQQPLDIATPRLNMDLNLANDGLSGASVAQNLGNIGDGIAVNLMPIFKIPPTYPNRAKMLKKEGVVVLEFTITKEGLTSNIKVVKANPPKIFNKSAIKALSKWKFKPKIVGGKPVPQRAQQTIEYKLR
jgi:protein TonB